MPRRNAPVADETSKKRRRDTRKERVAAREAAWVAVYQRLQGAALGNPAYSLGALRRGR